MTTEIINTIKLTASENSFLTTKTVNEDGYRPFFSVVYLGVNDSADNYEEWSIEEKELWEADWAEAHPEEAEDETQEFDYEQERIEEYSTED